MRRFLLKRKEDVHGMSGTGNVAEGCEFKDGSVSLKWTSPYWSLTCFRSIHELKHIHSHEGKTIVSWIDPPTSDDIEEFLNEIKIS